ncbi:acetyl-CoA decarbonylase/synthase complex subunit gamma [bacterium]|nr:MAG: acetyl-CoA decarbonylase/synthase complex subunit gamma [bacterium]
MALSGLDIYKLLPKTNCRECGFATCLAFAMQLAKKAVSIDKCPYLSEDTKKVLEASSLPPIRLITVGTGAGKLEIGNETVLFRHEEKFHHPCGLGFIVDDDLTDVQIKHRLQEINKLGFERVGQRLDVNLVAIRQKGDKQRFIEAVQILNRDCQLNLLLISDDAQALGESLAILKGKRPVIYCAKEDRLKEFAKLADDFKVPLVVFNQDLDKLSFMTKELNNLGVQDLILDTGKKPISDKIWDLTQIRRQSLKKSNRSLGYPVLTIIDQEDIYEETQEAATYIAKYAGIVLLSGIEPAQALALLTLRQNIYTDPQRPLQIEPKLYAVGAVNPLSPVLVTTNFSLSYYTVLGEVEASKVPAYIISVDTEGMSVLTAWAAEKFTPEKISNVLSQCLVKEAVTHRKLIIPGYVAVISGDLEDKSGWQVIVGPKEAAGIPSFLKNLK